MAQRGTEEPRHTIQPHFGSSFDSLERLFQLLPFFSTTKLRVGKGAQPENVKEEDTKQACSSTEIFLRISEGVFPSTHRFFRHRCRESRESEQARGRGRERVHGKTTETKDIICPPIHKSFCLLGNHQQTRIGNQETPQL